MTRSTIAGGAFATVVVLLAVAAGYRALNQHVQPAPATSSRIIPSTTPTEEIHQGLLYGRITTIDKATYEGRLRWGRDQEAFWGDYFNGSKNESSWAAHVPLELLPKERRPIEILGIKIAHRESRIDPDRQFMARFGEIARIEGSVRVVRVTLKSGTVLDLDRSFASDFDDGVRGLTRAIIATNEKSIAMTFRVS
jgi:hypothetical protein